MKLHHSLPLHSHLIKPVQRILKYPLLLEVLILSSVYLNDFTKPAYVYQSLRNFSKISMICMRHIPQLRYYVKYVTTFML